ncbi:MAG: hypothetical protein FJX68_10145 [Alphaproteobacteria bacterium]|nr:hypothetical protein [Alphaproteobacteria bacterium]
MREVAIPRVGHLSNAPDEMFQHERIARGPGMAETKITALKRGAQSSAFSLPEKAALRFTDDVVADVPAGDAGFAAAAQFLSPRQRVERNLTVGYCMLTCRLLESFAVTIEPEGVTQGRKLKR